MPWNVEKNFSVLLGGCSFVDSPNLITFDGQPLFQLERNDESGYLGVTFRVFDEHGSKLVTIGRNTIYPNPKYKGPKHFEIEGGVNDWVLLETDSGSLICGLKRKEAAEPAELQITVNLYCPNGKPFRATPEMITTPGENNWIGCGFNGCGIHIERDGSFAIG